MMPSRSTPNLQSNSKNHAPSIYSYLQNQSGLSFAPVVTAPPARDDESPPPAPPVRDSSSLKSIKYGPGHEKFPSWPVPAAAETPQVLKGPPSGGSHRSKSWTDHTNYPKEKVVTYTRPYMKRQHSSMQQKLKTVMEKCEKITPEMYESRLENRKDHLYLPHVDREGKPLGDMEYMVPSPPERDNNKTQLTQADLEKYVRAYEDPTIEKLCQYSDNIKGSLSHLTQAELEQYTRNYEDTLNHQHQKQPSYAQSEGYHSYVSSTDSSSTPFLDRLRRDSEAATNRSQSSFTWEEINEQDNTATRWEGRDSVVTNSSGSASSSETLKWHGSMSDVSVASSSCTHPANSPSSSISRQLIAHSARVQTPQKHHSESVLYMGSDSQNGWKDQEKRNNNTNKLKLFPINTYTVEPSELQHEQNERLTSLTSQQSLSVADRVNELEKQRKYSYLDPDKKHRIPDPTLKAIQKRALLSFYERHHPKNNWRSEPQLARSQPTLASVPQPPPRVKLQSPSRRASSASDYASGTNSRRSSFSSRDSRTAETKMAPRHQHSNSCGSLSSDLLGPVIVGPSISVDDWIPERPPERPPKNPQLRSTFPALFQTPRLPSPDLPPPSPPPTLEDEVINNDEPLPPPPPELRSADWSGNRQFAEPQVETKSKESPKTEQLLRGYAERSSVRYPAVQKVHLNGNIAVSQKVTSSSLQQYRAEPLRPIQKGEDLKLPGDERSGQRASIAESFCRDAPPPLQPRQMRINQSMRARIPDKRRSGSPTRGEMGSRSLTYTLSHSKASYLASRRERERIVPDSDTGVYKRTMSPNGHALSNEAITDSPKVISRDSKWPLNRSGKEVMNNNTNLIRRVSMNDKCNKANTILSLHTEKDEYKKPPVVLPDVLPVKEKILPYRSQYPFRPPQLENGMQQKHGSPPKYESPPASPSKSPSRNSPFTPLRSTLLSSPLKPLVLEDSVRTSPLSSSIKPISPIRSSPMISTATNTPSPSSPPASPKVYFTSYPSPPQSPNDKEEHPAVVEGLQMIQRTEVILRVNVCTTDAASQTEKDELPPTPLPTRRKLQEEIECEKLSQDLIKQLPPTDRLKEILLPGPDYKKPTDYVSGLFRPEITSRPRPLNSPFRSRTSTPNSSPPPPSISVSPLMKTRCVNCNQCEGRCLCGTFSDQSIIEPSSPLSPTSTYFTTSEPKAKFLTRYSQEFSNVKDTKDLNLKKEELVNRLDRKLEVLRGEQVVVFEECRLNDELGENVDVHMNKLARPHEYSKFCLHVEEVGKITSLLLGLCGRLARAENALMSMDENHAERRILEAKRDKLKDQLEEAKKLKESIDRRSVNVSNILCKYMNSDEYADYDHFINMKAKLIMDAREIADKIKLGEEQLLALKETLMTTD
ncbi:protein Shroom isoform X1 [Photinus pyralis]|uniref:protein Shroom isoform X1 n=1 Tax=Photinus pyralis TaxID=7054 RepID=UPI00126714E1|nr:protein Shroom isoform X1 [Photinus pyralis]XP_031342250.1 protein Shroom isoform X1 [Photinus pyralis]XP_031342251.1 protein Shroom isoform X1 [Photinus pyralis]XP_031342252.1 protein Shroom isoform X1 [Photinus pyralis]